MIDVERHGYLGRKELRVLQKKLPLYNFKASKYWVLPMDADGFVKFFLPFAVEVLRLDDPWVNCLRNGQDYVYPLFSKQPMQLQRTQPSSVVATLTEGYNEEVSTGM